MRAMASPIRSQNFSPSSRAVNFFRAVVVYVLLCASAAFGTTNSFFLKDNETVVFVGDSITAAGLYTVYVEGYVATRFPERKMRFINSGRGSETLSGLTESDHPGPRPQLFSRFKSDAVEFNPTVLVACYGMNDGIYHPFTEERFRLFKKGVLELVARNQSETKARLVLLTPPTFDPKTRTKADVRPDESYGYKQPYANYNDVLELYSGWLMTFATNIVTADVHSLMQEHLGQRRQQLPSFRMQGDGIHPNATGHMLIALALLKAWQAPAVVSDLTIDAAAGKVIKGEARDFQNTNGTITLTWTSHIPMPMDDRWDLDSVKLAKLNETVNEHRLKVTGLRARSSDLTVNGKLIGRFPTREMSRGIDLLTLPDLPTNLRARQVLSLIEQRRKLGNAAYRGSSLQDGSPASAQILNLEKRLREACQPMEMKIQITPAR
jgi:lysophospholipase L1-like esterase